MIQIQEDLCIGCGDCVGDCPSRNLALAEDCAKVLGSCMQCGHCVAICPVNAVAIPDYTMEDVTEYKAADFGVAPDTLLNFMKFRRSVRQFTQQAIEEEKLRLVIEAGRYAPTGGNLQNVRYIVVQEQLQALRGKILKSLHNLAAGQKGIQFPPQYAPRFRAMYELYLQEPNAEDELFFFAPLVVFVVSNDSVPAALASTGMELEANALGLGCLYSGFSTRAINCDEDCRAFLGLKEGESAVTALVLGYSDVAYLRTPPRKSPHITRL